MQTGGPGHGSPPTTPVNHMVRVHFTAHLLQFVGAPDTSVSARTVGEALEAVFAENGRLRGYIIDDQGRLRRHIMLFVDGAAVPQGALRRVLSDDAEIHVMQALSGG